MTAEQLLNDLGMSMGLADLRFDQQGCARLVFDSSTTLNLENDVENATIQVYAVLGILPASELESLFRKLLEGNLFGAKTNGATLAIDGLENEIILCRSILIDELSGQNFTRIIERFLEAVEHWQAVLVSGRDQSESDRPAAVPSESIPIRA